jgi:hypothetical protein
MRAHSVPMTVVMSALALAGTVLPQRGYATTEGRPDTPFGACVLVGGLRAPARLRVYVEQKDNKKGASLWSGTIARDQRIKVSSSTDRIIYDYRYDDSDTWKEENHTWCHNDADEKVP